MKLASFDIFDTVLIRKCGAPDNLFYLLAARLYPDDRSLREAFLLWRKYAPGKMTPQAGRVEISLEELYKSAADAGFVQYSPDDFIKAELSVESDNLIRNQVIADLIKQKRSAGYKIAFISDMYLDSDFLRNILMREKCFVDGDALFVSSECNARKDTGKLFDYVKNKLTPEYWEHYGDNKRSDVKIPRKYGIKAQLIDTQYTDVEKECLQISNICADPYQLKICAAASRAARLHLGNTPEVVLAADFVAPTYLPYISFLQERARAEGIKRLYFLSRDGWILHQAAECGGFDGIQLKDFFVSRRSLMLPYLACDFSREAYLRIVDRNTLLRRNVSHMLWQLNLTEDFIGKEFNCKFDYAKILTPQQENDFLDKIFTGRLGDFLRNEAKHQYELLWMYFIQEGLLDNTPSAMVDVGWLGTSRLMINTILRHNNHSDIKFFYFGVRKDVLTISDGDYESFLRENEYDVDAVPLVEHYFSASKFSSTVGYKEENGSVIPVWDEEYNENALEIAFNNSNVLQFLIKTTKTWLLTDILILWNKLVLFSLVKHRGRVDISPLRQGVKMDGVPLCKKLTIKELLEVCFSIKRVSCLDYFSLILTCGSRMGKLLWNIRRYPDTLKCYIYRIVIRGRICQ